jgi:hypothetical protein
VRVAAIAGCLAAVGLAGCYGSTEPATDVGDTEATLHARGTANNGAAYSFFEYWRTAHPDAKLTTARREWPAGASSAFSEQVGFLGPATSYSFRLCGGDQANPADPVCAQTRSFTTTTPTGDVATGHLRLFGPGPGITLAFLATSGPSGENPSGQARGEVTCLSVSGSRATVGSVDSSGEGLLIWAEEDPPGSGSGRIAFAREVPPPVDCSTPVGGAGSTLVSGNTNQLAIYDTP